MTGVADRYSLRWKTRQAITATMMTAIAVITNCALDTIHLTSVGSSVRR